MEIDSSAQGAILDYKFGDNSNTIDAKLFGGREYSGTISMDGRGFYKWNDGTSYDGDFQNGEMTGFGIYKFQNGVYNGHVYDGIRNGHGVLILNNFTKYIGEWYNGRRHGKGIIYYNYDDNTNQYDGYYDGDWIHGKRDGNGICIYKNGDQYDGEWKNNSKCGKGIMKWISLNEIYYGDWMNNQPHGKGIHLMLNTNLNIDSINSINIFSNSTKFNHINWYFGSWTNGERNGYGIYHYSNGSQYAGNWIQNRKNDDNAQYIYENGTKFIGKFQNDQQIIQSDKKEDLRKQIDKHFVFNISDLKFKLADIKLINCVLLRQWTSVKDIFINLCKLDKLWIIIELYPLKNIQKQIHFINQNALFYQIIHQNYNYVLQNMKINITNTNHSFLFREFSEILLRLSVFSNDNFEDFLFKIINLKQKLSNISLQTICWNQLPESYSNIWKDQQSKNCFDEEFMKISKKIVSLKNIHDNDNVVGEFIYGSKLKEILENIFINNPDIQSMVLNEFGNMYNNMYNTQEEALIIRKYDINYEFETMTFLVYECKLFFIILCSIKISYNEMMTRIEKEKEKEKEKREQEERQKTKNKGKKVTKDNETSEMTDKEEEIQRLQFTEITKENISNIFRGINV